MLLLHLLTLNKNNEKLLQSESVLPSSKFSLLLFGGTKCKSNIITCKMYGKMTKTSP